MLHTLFIMLKRGAHYRAPTIDDEQLAVQRNAARWITAPTRFGCIAAVA
ncbi:MAG: hypothetical protein AW10_01285 [Candidatus Accumulibacter appositus]|uniref:Uncharacterized protein n=1 Tax=Candidatus Accumulibacter appositus TaxID=1454003 RepID=A0A011P0V9_9PROT|nr:hypothetical protein [Accumulibacter sp.]EXI81271.1 MAG: hypothetical protein AW10_01285 [Candidatus Accumulibacter appositus]HRF06159.1 hypothetical protein [Accumulibacter sp.]